MADEFASIFGDQAASDLDEADTNPFAKIMPRAVAAPSSTSGAFARGVARGAAPAVGGIAGATAGAEAGFVGGGLIGGPLAWLTAPGGAIVGGLAGGYAGAAAVSSAQHWAMSKLPDSWREAIGMDDRQERLDEGEHPVASFLGGIAPYAVTMNPAGAAKKVLAPNATAMERIMAHPATARVFGGAAMGGIELGQEAVSPDPVDWRKVAISTGMGVVFNRPNVIGQRIGEPAAAAVRRMPGYEYAAERTRQNLGISSPQDVSRETPAPAATAAPAETPLETAPAAPRAAGIAPTLFHAPTVAQAGDAKVLGPGITEEVFHGTHEMNPAARDSTQQDARTEASVIGPLPQPDMHSLARRSTPDLFAHYDDLRGQERDFQAWLDANPADPAAQNHLAAVQQELAAVEPQVSAAYRRAAESVGQPIVPHPEPVAHVGRPIEEQRQFIADDVARQLTRAGRPADEAQAAGQLVAARYEARASQFAGARGSAEDLYRADAAEILGPGMRSRQAAGIPTPRGPRTINERALSLFQFLAHRGGLAPHPDIVHTLGENPFLPGFGRLIRQSGMSLDRAREAAVEAGYLHDQGAIEGRESESSINQLLEAIDNEARGNKLYRAGHRPEEGAAGHAEPEPEPEGGAGAAERPPEPVSPLLTAEDEKAIAEFFQRKRGGEEPNLFAEREAEGQQGLPGTERISEAELAQRRANESLKPKVAQKPMDVGLFGDEKGQKELFQRDQTAPPFYSAVERAVISARTERASPDQWLATIKNTAGVKAEELEWLGLADWLKEQKGPVSKQQIADYVRANSVEVREVEKGAVRVLTAGERDELINLSGIARRPEQEARYRELRNIERISAGFMQPGSDIAKFTGYQLPGGENYRELLLTLPEKDRSLKDAAADRVHEISTRMEQIQDEFDAIDRMPETPDLPARRLALYNEKTALYKEWQEQHRVATAEDTSKFKSAHWDEPNVLAHVRFNDRTIDGKKTLFIEEVQSDWHQKGRRQGYKTTEPHWVAYYDSPKGPVDVGHGVTKEAALKDSGNWMEHVRIEYREEAPREVNLGGVPDAPFKTSWPELSLKRMIRYAAEHGYEQVAWTPGKVQAERYDLSKQISDMRVVRSVGAGGNHYTIDATLKGRSERTRVAENVPEVQLEDHVGKEMARKIVGDIDAAQSNKWGVKNRASGNWSPRFASKEEALAYQQGLPESVRKQTDVLEMAPKYATEYSGLDLHVGGEGMSAFYDKMLPAAANKLVKRYGGRVGEGTLKADNAPEEVVERWAQQDPNHPFVQKNRMPVHTLPIPDTLRESALGEGFPLFQGARGKIRLQEGRRPIITLMADANASTFIHETGHEWLEQLMRDAEHEAAPDALKTDASTALKWLGVEHYDDIGRREHEKFARGFEQYLREGIAPSAGLANVFARFKNWLVQIYQSLKGLGAPISEDIRRVFDRMLVAENHGAVIAPEREIARSMADEHELDARDARPAEQDPWGDRVAAEAERTYVADSESTHEFETWLAAKAEHEATGGEPGAEPAGGQAGPGGGEAGELHGVRPGPENVAPGGGVGEPVGAQREGGTATPGGGTRPSAGAGEPRSGESGAVPLAPSPAARFEPVDERVTDLAGNIRVDNLTSINDIAQAIHDSADRNADFVNVRGSMTKGQMMDLADAMGLDADKIDEARLAQLLGGTANLAPRILAARKLVVQSAQTVSDAMKAAATGGDEEVAKLAMVIARHDMIQGVLAGATAEWGRAGNAFHSLQEGWGTAQAVEDFLKQNTGRTLFQLKQIAKLGTQLDTPGKISKYLRDAQQRSFGGMILEYWINGLISGPATHTTYMIGNAILAAEKAGPETAAAALIGSLRKAMGREGETVRLGEVGAQFRAAGRNLPGAIEAGMEGMRSGMTTLLPGEAGRPLIPFSGDTSLVTARGATNAPVSWADLGSQMFANVRSIRDGLMGGAALIAAGGERGAPLLGWHWSPLGQIPDVAIRGVPAIPVGSALRMPGRFIAAIHSFFRMTNYSMEKARLAYRTAANEGLTGTAFDARVGDIWQNPSEEVMAQAVKEATNLTLMGQGGAFVKALSALTNAKVTLPVLGEFAPLKFVDPFVHIGANVINQSIVQRSPVGVLSKEIRADLMGLNGNIAQDTAMARMLVGTALSVAFGGLAAQGLASGSGPKDPKEAAMWKLAGNQPHSVRVGDMWIDVHRLGPMGMLMGVAADMYDVAHHAGEQEYLEAAAHLQHAITQNVLDESFMRGPAELIRAVEDPGRYGDAYLRNMLSSFVPFSVGMAQVARAADPYSRQARTVTDAMMAKVPGLSENLLPRRDIWGEPMQSLRTLGPQGLLAVWMKQVSTDPVNAALYDIGVFPGQVPRKIRNVDLTDQEFDDFARIAGRMSKMRLDTIVKSPDWRTWPNHAKVSVVQEVIRQSRETARGVMMARYPHIPKDATAAKLEALND